MPMINVKLIEGVSEVLFDITSVAGDRRLAWRLGLRLLSRGIERLRGQDREQLFGKNPFKPRSHVG